MSVYASSVCSLDSPARAEVADVLLVMFERLCECTFATACGVLSCLPLDSPHPRVYFTPHNEVNFLLANMNSNPGSTHPVNCTILRVLWPECVVAVDSFDCSEIEVGLRTSHTDYLLAKINSYAG